ncbi:MAG: trypsin-like peptidase domain-containing protein [Clostridia bacterium]|nr:trypsin-like peptidase domain-containing protein [Clostridia bacterium]
MNDNKEFDDVFSDRTDEPEVQQESVEAEKVEEPKKGFEFPKPPVNDVTYHFAGEPYKEEPARYFETVEKKEEPAEKAAAPAFNPYEAKSSNTAFQNNSSSNNAQQYVNPQYTSQPAYDIPQKKKGKKAVKIIVAICAIIAVALIAVGLMNNNGDVVPNVPGTSAPTQDVQNENMPQISTTEPGRIEEVNSVWVAEKVRPSVVGVMTYKNGQLAGEGSGVLWMEEGEYTYVITCAHVINEKGVTYGVLLLDGKSYEATLVGADTRTDIGVVKIKAKGLPLAELGDSGSLKIGEPVYAIGNPGGSEYFGSLTDGIVSAIDRSVTATYKMTCIQHNAAINPGNSGGALVNTAGQIVGINSSKIASTEYEGMGFAVPTSIAKPVAEALVKYSYVPNRPKLGIEYAPVSAYQLYSMVVSIKGLPQGSLVIAGISADSSLKDTDAQVGDLIIGVNGKDMNDSSVLLDLIETGAVGDTLTLTLCRINNRTYKTDTFDITITLVEDKGSQQEEEETTQAYNNDGYYYGGASDFEDFFNEYFFGW